MKERNRIYLGILKVFVFFLVLGGVDGLKKEKDIFQIIEDNNEERTKAVSTEGGATEKLVEGDIVDTEAVEAVINGDDDLNDASTDDGHLWPKGVVPYVFAPGTGKKLENAVEAAAKEYASKTCIRWKRVSRTTAKKQYKSYVEFYNGFGCFSMIGRQRGKQQISLGNGCQVKGIALHEMMHALGFWHEQSRMDRDKHIQILKKNIKDAFLSNFKKYRRGEAKTLGAPYDERSIMHYGAYAFSKNGKKTIINKHDWKGEIGQRKGLSKIDILQLNMLYNCPKKGKGNGSSKKKVTTSSRRRRSKSKSSKTSRRRSKTRSGGSKSNSRRRRSNKGTSRRRSKTKSKGCKDDHQYCSAWKKEGQCKKEKYIPFMKKSCRKSCKFC